MLDGESHAKRPRTETQAVSAEELAIVGEKNANTEDGSGKLGFDGPPLYAMGGYVDAGEGWFAHSGMEWLYNIEEKTYFHLPTGELHLATTDGTKPFIATGNHPCLGQMPSSEKRPVSENAVISGRFSGRVLWFNATKGFGFIAPTESNGGDDLFVHRNQLLAKTGRALHSLDAGALVTYSLGKTDDGRNCAVQVQIPEECDDAEQMEEESKDAESDAGGVAESSASSVELDLEQELFTGTYQLKGDGKDQCEDFVVEKAKLPISVLGESATCIFFGVFDGHGGATCAEYASNHLAKNVLARLRDRSKTSSDEMALRIALLGAFRQTEHNFLQHARRVSDPSGSTACTMTVFGPDEEMRLRLFMANAGDTRAVLGRVDGTCLRLTEDHKPNLPAEKKRIEQAGGSVAEVAGVWRCILPQKRRISGAMGLAVSRGLGDREFKGPDIVSAEPEITIHEVDWDTDEFVVLASDGVWDVLSDTDAVRFVQQRLRLEVARSRGVGTDEKQPEHGAPSQGQSPEVKVAEALVRWACERGSKDDCTALIVRFGWATKKPLDETKSDGGDLSDETIGTVEEEEEAVTAKDLKGSNNVGSSREKLATLKVLQALRRLANSSRRSFARSKQELEKVLDEELLHTGDQKELLRRKANKICAAVEEKQDDEGEEEEKEEAEDECEEVSVDEEKHAGNEGIGFFAAGKTQCAQPQPMRHGTGDATTSDDGDMFAAAVCHLESEMPPVSEELANGPTLGSVVADGRPVGWELFEGLGPTKEELAVCVGPTLLQGTA